MKRFGAFLLSALLPWLLICTIWADNLIPASYWMSIDKFYVQDDAAGDVPRVALDRTIRRPIVVDWYMTLYRNENGTFQAECRTNGRDSRTPGDKSPNSLSWWFDHGPCVTDLKPGKYYVEESLQWRGLVVIHSLDVNSSVFTIWPPGDPHLSGPDLQQKASEAPLRSPAP